MNKLRHYFMLTLVVVFVGCSDDKSTTPSEPAETLLTTATIGAGGGTVSTSDFVLTVPAGALTSEVALSLYDAGDDHPFGDDAISPVYRIKGLPEEFSQPLQIRLKYEGTLSEESFIAQSVEDDLAMEDEPVYIYDFLAATDSSGFLLAEVPARSGELFRGKLPKSAMEKGAAGIRQDDFMAIANFKSHVNTAHFKIIYPLYLIDYVDDLKSYLDAAYDAIVDLGLGYQGRLWTWPMEITISHGWEKSSPVFAFVLVPIDKKHTPKLMFNADKLSMANLHHFKNRAGWGMMMVAQTIYENGRKAYEEPSNGWLHVAVAAWAGGLIDDDPQNHVPWLFPGVELAVFSGLRAGAVGDGTQNNISYHGNGISPVIKFLMEDSRFGKDGLLRCYQYIKNGDDATTALIDALYDTEDDWFPDFFRQYLQGNIYNVGGDVFTISTNISGTMNTNAETLKEFPDTYPDLSAKLYRINLSANKLPTGASISFEVDATQTNEDYVTTQIYRIKDNKLEFITEGLNVTVGGVKESAQEGYDLIACVVNASNEAPYTGSSPLELTVRVISSLVLDYPRCRVRLTGITGLQTWRNTVTGASGSTETSFNAQFVGNGSFTGNTFQASWDETVSGYRSVGTMSVTVDPVARTVTAFSASETTTATDYIYTQTIASVSGKHLTMGTDTEVDLIFFEQGVDETCDYFTYSNHNELQQSQETWVHDVVAIGCNDVGSTVAMEFYKSE